MADNPQTVRIERLGAQGDGVAVTPEGPVHVPFALPGETVEISGAGQRRRLGRVLSASPDRIAPFCPHFGECGGCRLQHLDEAAYRAWKSSLLAEALAREGIAAAIAPIQVFARASRRRAVFSAIRDGEAIRFGFARRDSDRIVDVTQCGVLEPRIGSRIALLRGLAGMLAPRRGTMKFAAVATDAGLDLAAETGAPVSEPAMRKAIGLAAADGVARLSLNGETLIEAARPELAAGIARVRPPASTFVQAVAQAEDAMARVALQHLSACAHVADLFSGYGAFGLRLAGHSRVDAFDNSAAALAAMDEAWRRTGGRLKAIATQRRDLMRSPLDAAELETFDGVVFDPPRAGAEAQSRELAKSRVRRIVAISCNPVTLARDLRILADGGYRVAAITPFDQFAFSPHLEAAATLMR
jgi:23S rRNA (uracil1939-C5)-methyltransferase